MKPLTIIIHGSFLNAQLVKTFCAHWGNALALDFYIYAKHLGIMSPIMNSPLLHVEYFLIRDIYCMTLNSWTYQK